MYWNKQKRNLYTSTAWSILRRGHFFLPVFGEVDNKMDLIYLRYQTLSLYVCNSVETSHEFLDVKTLRPAARVIYQVLPNPATNESPNEK